MQLEGKVAIVTGAARGLGRAYAEALASEGAAVVAADINDCGDTVAAIEAAGGRAVASALDVSDSDSCAVMAALAAETYGRIDILINNAAIFTTLEMKPFYNIDPAEWANVVNVNLNGVYACARQVVDTMKENGFGRIINIGSAAVTMGRPNYTHYVASKSALIGMSRSMARELGSFGITVNTIMLGATFTEIERKTVTQQQKDAIVASQCIQRPATPDDILGTVLFLCSEESGFVTGQAVTIDGGATHS